MRIAALIIALGALAACGPPDPYDDPPEQAHPRQQPSTLTPGISVSGYANVGVIRRF